MRSFSKVIPNVFLIIFDIFEVYFHNFPVIVGKIFYDAAKEQKHDHFLSPIANMTVSNTS